MVRRITRQARFGSAYTRDENGIGLQRGAVAIFAPSAQRPCQRHKVRRA